MNSPMAAKLAGRLTVAAWLLLPTIAIASEPQKAPANGDPSACELIIEGRRVERLVLATVGGQPHEIDQPGASVFLPAGCYRVLEIRVHWDDHAPVYSETDLNWLTLTESRPCHLMVGSPESPQVTARLQDTLLVLRYTPRSNNKIFRDESQTTPPQFAVYDGDNKIGGGSFEYG